MFKHLIVVVGVLCFFTFAYAEVEVVGGGTVSLKSSDGVIIEDVIPSIVTTELDHWMTHMGAAYTSSDTISIPAGATYKFLMKNIVDAKTHMARFSFNSTQADAAIAFYEGSTVGDNGTEITPRNNNRNFADASNVQVFINASTSALGTQLEHDIITGSKQVGGSGGDVDEWIFKQYTTYVITYTNNSGSADVISYHFDFLEVGLLP
jgi:hypothetical protein